MFAFVITEDRMFCDIDAKDTGKVLLRWNKALENDEDPIRQKAKKNQRFFPLLVWQKHSK
jgi:hypothetical protein